MKKLVAPVVILLTLTGCALQQAPLVYSSKISVGVDLSATSSETPGASINLGYKSVDAAYVPVAVSKKIDDIANKTDTLKIELIAAKYGAGTLSNSRDAQATLGKLHADLQAASTASETLRSTINIMENNQRSLQQRAELLSQLDATLQSVEKLRPQKAADGIPTDNAAFTDALKPAQETIGKLAALNVNLKTPLSANRDGSDSVATVKAEVSQLKATADEQATGISENIKKNKSDLALSEQKVTSLKSDIDNTLNMYRTDKTDALSVYGRFDSNGSGSFGGSDPAADGKGGKAGLLVGKVFSTGLASQNLTEAVKFESVTRCLLAMSEILKSAPEAERKGITDKLTTLCEPKAR